MKSFIAIVLCWHFATCAMADEFDEVRELAQRFLVQTGTAAGDIQDIYLNSISGGSPNSKKVEQVADVAFRIRGQGTRYVQLFQRAGTWQALRTLAANQLAGAYPLLIDEYSDEYRRETARLEQRIAADLQARLIAEKKIDAVNSSRPRCIVDVKHNKALCDIFYTTWERVEPECSNAARLFTRQNGDWSDVPGKYHSGMRINPDTGEVFTMIPEQDC